MQTNLTKYLPFHTTCLRRVLKIFWPEKISNEDMLKRCKQEDMDAIIRRRHGWWLGHYLWRKTHTITRKALHWTPDRKTKERKTKNFKQHGKEQSRVRWKTSSTLGAHWRGWLRTGRSGKTLLLPKHHRVILADNGWYRWWQKCFEV